MTEITITEDINLEHLDPNTPLKIRFLPNDTTLEKKLSSEDLKKITDF